MAATLQVAEPSRAIETYSLEAQESTYYLYDSWDALLGRRIHLSGSPEDRANRLHEALYSDSNLERKEVAYALSGQDETSRVRIATAYRTLYSEDLVERCIEEHDGCTRGFLKAWLYPRHERDAMIINKALRSDTPNLRAATETICSCNKFEIQKIKESYSSKFDVHLEDDIEAFTNGHDRELLLAHIRPRRIGSLGIDEEMLDGCMVAEMLNEAMGKICRSPEQIFINTFTQLKEEHLAAVSIDYQNSYSISLNQKLKRVTSGNFKHGLLTILECAQSRPFYFAKLLQKATKDLDQIDYETIGRVIVTRAERDMDDIKEVFLKEYGRTLKEAVYAATSGLYRKFLLSLLDHKAISQPN